MKKVNSLVSIVFLLCLIILSSCTVHQNFSYLEDTVLLSDIPFYPQEKYQCGPASLAGVLNYWGIQVTPEDIARDIYSTTAKGTLTFDMVIYPQQYGLTAAQYDGNLDDLKKNITSGYPVIVLVDYGFSFYQANHFMVVVGFNEKGIIANSGKDKETFIHEKDFLSSWKKTKFWTLLIKEKK